MNIEFPRNQQVNETEEFKIFSEEIDYLIDFFHDFSELLHCNGHIIPFLSDKEIYYLNTALIDSSTQTLKSIKLCCSIGSVSDANTLIRKLRDDLIQFVYFLSIIKARKPFYEDEMNNVKINDPEAFANSLSNLHLKSDLTKDEQAVTAWFSNTVTDLPNSIRKKLTFENYMNVLKQNKNIAQILVEYNLQQYWEDLRKKLNNYVHNNGIGYVIQNHISVYDKHLSTCLKNITIRTSYISSFFLALLIMTHSSLIASTDYIDHLDADLEPPEDGQYFVANFIKEFIDKKVAKLHPALKQYLQDNNNHGMKI